MTDEMDEILDKFEETEQVSQEYSRYQSEIKDAKQELAQKVVELEQEEKISTTKAEEISRQIQNANYGKARQLMKEALEKQGLEFDAEEKNLFAESFTEQYERLQENTEMIRNSLMQLKDKEVSNQQLIGLIYGSTGKYTKSELEAVFDSMDKINNNKLSLKDQARILAAFESDLTISTTKEILEEIKQRSDL